MKHTPGTILDMTPTFKPGDPAPTGYLEWHEWAKVQYRAGLRQAQCRHCGRWVFPQEAVNHGEGICGQ